jgi:hypothetical protein
MNPTVNNTGHVPVYVGNLLPNGASPEDQGFAYLSPDALMTYCESRMRSIDEQVRTGFVQQRMRNQEQSDLQGVLETLQKYAAGVGSPDGGNHDQCKEMELALQKEIEKIKATDPGSPVLAKLTQTYNDLVYTGSGEDADVHYIDRDQYPPKAAGREGDCIIDNQEMTAFTTAIQNAAGDLNSGSELEMIQLQSLMSQRQTAIQLTTNMVQSLDDSSNKIAQNVGH